MYKYFYCLMFVCQLCLMSTTSPLITFQKCFSFEKQNLPKRVHTRNLTSKFEICVTLKKNFKSCIAKLLQLSACFSSKKTCMNTDTSLHIDTHTHIHTHTHICAYFSFLCIKTFTIMKIIPSFFEVLY